jgi:hypothetical protein
MAQLDINNVIQVTLLSALRGLSDVNTSVLALITDEEPIPADYGAYQIYRNPTGVADDFGIDSETYRLAVKAFSQSPNMLSGGGYLVIIPRDQTAAAVAATILGSNAVDLTKLTGTAYELRAAVDGGAAADLTIGSIDSSSLETAEASLNSYELETAGLVFEVTGEVAAALITLKSAITGATSAITLSAATTGTDIAPLLGIALKTATGAAAGVERVKDAILRTYQSVAYFGIILNEKMTDAALLEVANIVQTMDKLLIVGSSTVGDIVGVFKTIKDAGLTHTRCLYYSNSEADALDFAAGYAGRGLSINFSGTNTAHTMHLKEVIGMVADPGLTQTVLTSAKNNGVDTYADLGGVPKVFTSKENQFFDQVYSRLAFKLRTQVAGFNYLAQTNTKIPQTQPGMIGYNNAYRKVCEQFVSNGVFAPGKWNSPTTFGNPEDHIRNIAEVGYFVYSVPISQQSQTDREARIAPSTYIACKDSGAMHFGDVTVQVEA